MTEAKARQLNPLSMAFVGDSVFTLYVRRRITIGCDSKAGVLHKKANEYVRASAQAAFFDMLEPDLTEAERDIARRAKNAHNNTKAKNATIYDYKRATAFEAVLGYLNLTDQTDRMNCLMERCFDHAPEENENE